MKRKAKHLEGKKNQKIFFGLGPFRCLGLADWRPKSWVGLLTDCSEYLSFGQSVGLNMHASRKTPEFAVVSELILNS